MDTRLVMFSGGLGSFETAARVIDQHGTDGVVLLFTDVKYEDADLYRFLDDAERVLGVPITRLADGRDIWQVMRDHRFLANSRVDPCSRVLKREVADAWRKAHCDPATTTIYVGIDHTEAHRFVKLQRIFALQGWHVEAPLVADMSYSRAVVEARLARLGVAIPYLYTVGAPHNNCKGGCVKAGIKHWIQVLQTLPHVYAEWEGNEQGMRDFLGRDDIAMLVDRRGGGKRRPMTLTQLRRRVQGGEQIELTPEDEVPVECVGFCGVDELDAELGALLGAP
jgi:hypothetical protein